MEGPRGLGSSRPHSRSAMSPRGHWSCVLDNESTEGPERKTYRSLDRMLQKEEDGWEKDKNIKL